MLPGLKSDRKYWYNILPTNLFDAANASQSSSSHFECRIILLIKAEIQFCRTRYVEFLSRGRLHFCLTFAAFNLAASEFDNRAVSPDRFMVKLECQSVVLK